MKLRKIIAILLLFVFVLMSICGCTGNRPRINDYLDSTTEIDLLGNDIVIEYNEEYKNRTIEIENEINSLIEKDDSDINRVKQLFNEIVNRCYFVKSEKFKYNIIIEFGLDIEVDEKLDIEGEENRLSMSILGFLNKLSSTKYSKALSDYVDGDVDDFIENMERQTLTYIKYAEYQLKYYDIFKRYSDSNHKEAINDYVKEIRSLDNSGFVSLGYDNIVDLLYKEIYLRDFSYKDTYKLKDTIKVLANFYMQNIEKFREMKKNLSEKDLATFTQEGTFFGPSKHLFDKYANFIGDEYKENYNYLWNSGNYYLTSKKIFGATAAVNYNGKDRTYIIFTGGHQTTADFIHEFGHYNARRIGDIKDTTYNDVSECQSECNGALFSAYLEVNKLQLDSLLEFKRLNFLLSRISTIVFNYLIVELQNYVFLNVSDEIDIVKKYNELVKEYGMTVWENDDTWLEAALRIPGYEISYVLDNLIALEIYVEALNDISSAKEKYKKIYRYDKNFMQMIEDLNLISPFDNSYSIITTKLENLV